MQNRCAYNFDSGVKTRRKRNDGYRGYELYLWLIHGAERRGEAIVANFTTAKKKNSVVRKYRTTVADGTVVKDSFTTYMEKQKE